MRPIPSKASPDTADLRLEQLGPDHEDGSWAMLHDEEGRRLTATHREFTREEAVAWLHRIELGVYDFNPRAQRSYEKVGFRREGVRRNALCWQGEWHDEILMALLATDHAELTR